MRRKYEPKSEYAKKLLDPRWQKKRLGILERDGWLCCMCYDTKSTLHVHHRYYVAREPWDTPDDALITLCESCHNQETEQRQGEERRILYVFRRLFFAYELDVIAEGFENLAGNIHPQELAGTISASLSDDGLSWAMYQNFCANRKAKLDAPCRPTSASASEK